MSFITLQTMRTSILTASLLTGVAVVACGSSDDDDAGSSSGNNTTGTSGTSGTSGDNTSGFGGTSGGTSGSSGDGSNGGASSGTSGDGVTCATTSKKAEKQPLDMVIGLDTSFSMDFDDKWINVRDALRTFVGNPAYSDLNVGLQFFPIRKQCSVSDYASLAVPLTIQAQAFEPVSNQLAAQRMAGGTPMVPLLLGVSSYITKNTQAGHKPVIVLATDGFPDESCPSSADATQANTLENAVAIADRTFKGTPSVPTFVIGVGSELTSLDKIASAGGTNKATIVDATADARKQFLAALENIRKVAIPCDYDIPEGTIDPKLTNVTYTAGNQTRQMLYTKDAAGCDKAPNGEGWYFDNEAAPKKVIICKAVCDFLKLDDSANVDLVFGCPRNDVK